MWCMYLRSAYICISLTAASLRRSFRLRKDRQASPGEPQTPDTNRKEFLIYEEVTQYLPRPGERPRLIVLIGRFTASFGETLVCWSLHQDILCFTNINGN